MAQIRKQMLLNHQVMREKKTIIEIKMKCDILIRVTAKVSYFTLATVKTEKTQT